MSALPAETTEPVPATPRGAPVGVRLAAAGRAASRAGAGRAGTGRWSVVGVAVLVLSFGLTVGVLDVLH